MFLGYSLILTLDKLLFDTKGLLKQPDVELAILSDKQAMTTSPRTPNSMTDPDSALFYREVRSMMKTVQEEQNEGVDTR